jgi:riboflavin kinase/FMN adenylyltransferase
VFGREVPLINSAIAREDIIRRQFGIENVVFIHFNQRVMHMPWREFIQQIVDELGVAWIVVGHDFTFGDRGEGNAARLTEYCAETASAAT